MTYLWLALIFIGGAALAGLLLARHKASKASIRSHWGNVALVFLALAVLTAVFDSIMIGLELFTFDPAHILGLRVGLAPIEDFSYPLVCALLLPALWIALLRTRKRRGPRVSARELLTQAIIASRPVSWVNTAYPFAAALFLTTREVDWVLIVGTVYFLIPYNLAMYGINDVFDYASDMQNPRKGGIEGALLAPRLHQPMLWLIVITNVPFLIALAAVGSPAVWISLGVSVFAVIAYSAPRLRFKEKPVLDSVTSSTHFVSPAVIGLTLGGAEFTAGLVILLAAFFLWGMAAHAFGAVQDISPDRSAGIASIATVFGARRTVRLAMSLWAIAGVAMLVTPWPGPLAALVALPYLVNCGRWWNITDETSMQTNRAWRRFIWLNYASGFLVTMILILAWM